MHEKVKTVFYCDFCRKHGLSRHAMRAHEIRCTMNPWRVCGWHEPRRGNPISVLVNRIQERPLPLTRDDIDWTHDAVEGCPACMLAVLRQSGVDFHYDAQYRRIFEYEDEVKRFREQEYEEAQRDEWDAIQSTWL